MAQDNYPDHTLDLLINNPTLVIRHEINSANVLFHYENRFKYTISSTDGTILGTMQERDTGTIGMIGRQFTDSKRPFHIDVFDKDGQIVLTIKRSFQFITSKIFVIHNGYVIGKSIEKLDPIRRRYDLFTVEDGKETLMTDKIEIEKESNFHKFGKIKKGPFSFSFPIIDDHDHTIGSIDRNLVSVLEESYLGGGIFVVRLDSTDPSFGKIYGEKSSNQTLGWKERAVLLACSISLDFDHFIKNKDSN